MKRKDPNRKRPSGSRSFPEAQKTLVDQLVGDLGAIPPEEIVGRVPDDSLAERLIEALPAEESVLPLLLAMKEGFPGKKVHKAVRRLAFKMRQKGIPVETLIGGEDTSPSILRPIRRDPPSSYVGPVDGAGRRPLMVIVPGGGKVLNVILAVVSDEEGFLELMCPRVDRQGAKELKEKFESEGGPLVETTLNHAATLLEAAWGIHRGNQSKPPTEYLEIRPWLLSNTTLLERPAVYEWMPVASDSSPHLGGKGVGELLEHPLMHSWVIPRDTLKPYVAEILRVREGIVYLSDAQQGERVREIKEKCATEVFSAEERDRLKRRLEEMAYVFFKLGEEENARLALVAASLASYEHTAFRPNPFLLAMVGHSLDIYLAAMEKFGRERVMGEEKKSPLILP